jgi:ribosome assembly protein 1
VNSVVAELIKKDFLSAAVEEGEVETGEAEDEEALEQRENELFFCPEKGNVAFSSALDCWAFNLTMFSRRLAQKFGMNPRVL